MRRFVVPALVGLGVLVGAACSPKSPADDDDDNSGGSSATGGSGGKGGTGGTGGTSSMGSEYILPGPYAFPQNKKPPYCNLTTVAGASTSAQSAYTSWKSQYLVSGGTGLRVQRPENGNDTVSEGIGYGMLMAVYLNDRPTFDGLWTYAKQHLDGIGLMNWHITSGGTTASGGEGSATDADEDMAWALLVAYGQWGLDTYFDDGKKLANLIVSNEIAPDGMLKPGDAWGGSDKTYPDYFAPSYFRVFRKVTNNPNFDIMIKRNYEILAAVSGQYGLVPDQTNTAYDLSGAYKYDACRTPWRIGMDYCFYGAPEAKAYLDKIATFFDGVGVANIGDGYTLDGQKTSSFPNMAFVGPAGVAAMSGHQTLLDGAFTFGATGNGGTPGYFQQSLRVVTMLMMSGNFVDPTLP